MTQLKAFKVREERQEKLQVPFRVYFSRQSLLNVGLRSGDFCSIKKVKSESESQLLGSAIAWLAQSNINNDIAKLPPNLKSIFHLSNEDKIVVEKSSSLPNIGVIVLEDIGPLPKSSLTTEELESLSELLYFENYIFRGKEFTLNSDTKRRFKAIHLLDDNSNEFKGICRFTETSLISYSGDGKALELRLTQQVPTETLPCFKLDSPAIGGLDEQVQEINEALEPLNFSDDYLVDRGILIYGASGTGKTLLLDAVGHLPWKKTFVLQRSQTVQEIGDLFNEALKCQPSLIMIDDIHHLAPSRSSRGDYQASLKIIDTLAKGLDSLRQSKVFVAATARHANDVDGIIRTVDRLSYEIELPIPTAVKRIAILRAMCREDSVKPSGYLQRLIGRRTHGFVGRDLAKLLVAIDRSRKRRYRNEIRNGLGENRGIENKNPSVQEYPVTQEDVEYGLEKVHPTAMGEVILEVPKVHWSDIGGQKEVKVRLQEAIEWPQKYPEQMRDYGLKPEKGVLLYGPSGCSKTLLVMALANETKVNFISVKGPEIVSKYVGETEQALREIFRKARAAKPAIIFFDEIDSIASDSGTGQNHEFSIVSTFLTEMDGIEELKGVFVIAATNNPEKLPAALLRPGRIGNWEYIPPPDEETRKEIFKVWLKKRPSAVISKNIDLEELAHLSDGRSGADIIRICEYAGKRALQRRIQGNDANGEITREDFKTAIEKIDKSITSQMIEKYELWRERFATR